MLSQTLHIHRIIQLYNYTKMGICIPKKKDKQIVYNSKAIHRPQRFQNIDFYFESQNLLRITANCLLLFCDEEINLNLNEFLEKSGKFQTRKVAEYAAAYIANNRIKISQGTTIIFPINIPTLMFKSVCLTCLKVWDGHEKIRSKIQSILDNMFKAITEAQISSLAITEFNQQFGIPIQLGCKIIVQVLQKWQHKLKTVTFVFQSMPSQNYYMQKISKDKLELSSVYKQSIQSNFSNYY